MKPKCIAAVLIALWMFQIMSIPVQATDKEALRKIRRLVKNGSVVLTSETGQRLVEINAGKVFVPASISKIQTAMAALEILGPDYRFTTGFYTNDLGDLAIRGFGDPFLVSEEIRAIAQQLKDIGINRINRIFLDHSYFSDDIDIPGLSQSNNPYDAINGALVVNFNTIHVQRDASGVIVSAEPETPLTPLATDRARALKRGKTERINFSSQKADCRRYAGELFFAVFKEQGIDIADDTIGETIVDASWRQQYLHRNSRPLADVLRGLLEFSNNFIANQIFLALPQVSDADTPASMLKSRRFFEDFFRTRLRIVPGSLVMVEGSGISRSNRMSGNTMISILERFKPNASLLTLKDGHPVKSGTLTGVYNYAGYIQTERGLRSFVIMLNQHKNHRDAILKLLASI
jgi:D-alanyl-D-alanine carboxypeptidase/D-alanyl-D-alanine-endopeptidase (penicillin-binding protein 4)